MERKRERERKKLWNLIRFGASIQNKINCGKLGKVGENSAENWSSRRGSLPNGANSFFLPREKASTHTHTLCACSGLAWGIHQAFPKGRFSLLRFGLDVFTVYSSLALNTNLKWNGKEEKREIRALVCSCLQKAAAATPQAATHTHTQSEIHTHTYTI